LERLKNQK